MTEKTITETEVLDEAQATASHFTFGEPLKMARGKTSLSLERVANELNIGIHYLRAIENSNPYALPEPVFTMGFIRSYARFLNLEAQAIVDLYKREVLGVRKEWAKLSTTISTPAPPRNWLVLVATGVVIITYGVWFYLNRNAHISEQALSQTKKEKSSKSKQQSSAKQPLLTSPIAKEVQEELPPLENSTAETAGLPPSTTNEAVKNTQPKTLKQPPASSALELPPPM